MAQRLVNQIVVSADGRQTVAAVASHGQESAAGHRFEQLAHHSEGEFLLQGTASRPYDRQAADAFPPSAQQLEVQPLRPIIGRAVLATGKEVHVLGVSDVLVRTDRRRLERVLVNLIANAYKHGTPPVTVTIEGPVVTIRDHGPGYHDYFLEAGPQVPDQGYGHRWESRARAGPDHRPGPGQNAGRRPGVGERRRRGSCRYAHAARSPGDAAPGGVRGGLPAL